MNRTIISAVVCGLLVLAGCSAESGTNGVNGATGDSVTTSVAPSEVSDEPDMSTASPSEEPTENLITAVKIKSCKIGEYGVEVEGSIKNLSDEVSDMSATIEITNSAGDRIDEAGILEMAVKPGQKVLTTAVGMESPEDLPKKVTCTVLSVDRYPSS